MSREDSDEAYVLEVYVLDMSDEVLGEIGQQGHRFAWLLGDPGATGRQVKLPVDSYWPGHRLVVEYRELQHDQPVPIFDKLEIMTISGVHGGEQRALYDARRDTEIPAQGPRGLLMDLRGVAASGTHSPTARKAWGDPQPRCRNAHVAPPRGRSGALRSHAPGAAPSSTEIHQKPPSGDPSG